jgi:hypothetical protein
MNPTQDDAARKNFDPGQPVTHGDRLIEDHDGAPLPHELQRDGRTWRAISCAIYASLSDLMAADPGELGVDLDDATAHVVRALAPILWPLLPSNDHSAHARLVRAANDLINKMEDM